ncbi:MAG: hypothetical protein ACI4KM_08620 [Oscillospiraceae bacterium]
MLNIIKAQNYQARNDLVIVVALLFIGVIYVLSPQLNNVPFSELTGSMYAVNSEKTFLLFIVLFITARICGWDQSDKTINYEILAGHGRAAVYFGRIITCLIWTLASCAVLMFAPLGFCSAVNGWGYSADFSWVMIRCLLAFLPIIRVTLELALFTFLLRSSGLSIVLGYLLIEFSALADFLFGMDSDSGISWALGVPNLMHVAGFSDYSYGYVNGEDVVVYNSALEPPLIFGTVAASVIVGAVCLLLGYVVFKKRDMK